VRLELLPSPAVDSARAFSFQDVLDGAVAAQLCEPAQVRLLEPTHFKGFSQNSTELATQISRPQIRGRREFVALESIKSRRLRVKLPLVLGGLGLTLLGHIGTARAVTPNIIWNDEFEGASLDRGKWVVSDGAIDPANNSGSCFNNEAQSYKDIEGCGAGTSTICQTNGYLHLVARYWPNSPNSCGYTTNYVSSRMTTKTKFQMNPGMGNNGIRVEGRINMPAMTTGIFPAFWMLGSTIKQWPNPGAGTMYWPQAGEIDISEWGSAWSSNQSLGTMHYSSQDPSTYDGQYHMQIGSFYTAAMQPDAFHTYAVEWTWSSIKYFIDGAQFGPTVDLTATPSQDFNHDFSIILNNAIGGPGGGYAGIDPALVPQSTSSAGAGFDAHQRMAVDYVRVYALNNDGGWTARPFQGTGQYNAALPSEWDYGYYKADCGSNAALTGLSMNTTGITPHSMLCVNYGSKFSGTGVATVEDITSGDHRRASRAGDWDSGYYKSECGLNEYMSGVSQSTAGKLRGLHCSSGAGLTNGGQNNCETHTVNPNDQGAGNAGDWDFGYFKGECGNGKVAYGLSTNPSTGAPHRILCCDK